MSIKFSARHLDAAHIDRVYPLAGVALGLSLDEWRRFASGIMGEGSDASGKAGIMCLYGPDGTVYGMFAYRLVHDAADGELLECDHLATLDLLHGTEIRDAMGRAMDVLARQWGCQAVRVRDERPAEASGKPPRILDEDL